MSRRFTLAIWVCFLCCGPAILGGILRAEELIEIARDQMVHLRIEGNREWSSFPEQAEATFLERAFQSTANLQPWTLTLRQQDVKQTWDVRINDQLIGRLVRDENDLRTDFEIPAGTLVAGQNRLEIVQAGRMDPDDIRVGEIQIHAIGPDVLRRGATLEVVITDQDDLPIPGRITVVDSAGALMPLGATSTSGLAVREGVMYTATGTASFGLQPGRYRLFAGRGFEYSVESADVELKLGDRAKRTFRLTRQVDTAGWIACDTHVHTVTHSGHGDCKIEERMVTLAGEGIELPIATDHNKQVDYTESSQQAGTSGFFTPVVGNEVTTAHGHFNIFPTAAGASLPNHEAADWKALFDSIFESPQVRVAILNHARDLHSNFRPFSPRHHLSSVGVNLDGFDRRFNAMEVINSGAVQTDPMQLFGDWCGLINHGMAVTPVGSSDSHDVSRYIVGQGRTYIECDDSNVADLEVEQAVDSFLEGRVVVSYGLFASVKANDSFGPGQMVSLDDAQDLTLGVEILGPTWTEVERIELWVNGQRRLVQPVSRASTSSLPTGVVAATHWSIAKSELSHDAWLSVVAAGPGVTGPYWPCAKPYQPDSIDFRPSVFTSTGPLWIDADGDGQYTSPAGYARRILQASGFTTEKSEPDWNALAERLAEVDPSVIEQTLALLRRRSLEPGRLWDLADDKTRSAMHQFDQAWRRSVCAQLEETE